MIRSNSTLDGQRNLPLDAREAHVWSVLTDRVPATATPLDECLSEHELRRALRLRSPVARARFCATRTALRNILSLYTARPADELEISTGSRGKPALTGQQDLHFSLSHARNVAVIAVAPLPVGIDIEHARQPRNVDRLARRLLHEHTVATLFNLPLERRLSAFLDAWTQREAHVKAVGGGLFHTPDVLPFDVDAPDDGSVRPVVDYDGFDAWSVARFAPAAGFRATVVVQGHIDKLRFLEWNGAST
jgi:4'-phosphopantetheinyl transferase